MIVRNTTEKHEPHRIPVWSINTNVLATVGFQLASHPYTGTPDAMQHAHRNTNMTLQLQQAYRMTHTDVAY